MLAPNPLTVGAYARLHRLSVNTVKAWLERGQLPVAARDARGRRLLNPRARHRLPGAREVRSHAAGGLTHTAGGPGRLRKVSLAEREADRARFGKDCECACDSCLALYLGDRAVRRREMLSELSTEEEPTDSEARRML